MIEVFICKKDKNGYTSISPPNDRPFLPILIKDKIRYVYVQDYHEWFLENNIDYGLIEKDDSYYITFESVDDALLFKLSYIL